MTKSSSEAAKAIMLLINNRPGSPSADEIEAILDYAFRAPADGLVLTTTGAAKALADAWALTTVLQEAGFAQDKLPAEERRVDFERHEQAVNHRTEVLAQTILDVEPQSIDDLLSLLLITQDAFESFAANHSDHQTNACTEREADVIERAMEAMARWLVHKGAASSPLLLAYSSPAWLAPVSTQMASVLERARELSGSEFTFPQP
jgi:hypothetical protein